METQTENKEKKGENSYGRILKVTSALGGVQVFQILINLIRGKFVAMFLGPAGMGVASMFTSANNTITQFSSLGLNLSFVKETASARDDQEQLATIRYVAGLMIRVCALVGGLLCVLLAPWLSDLSFGTTEYTWQFMLLGISVYLNLEANGKSSILQGLHRVKIMSLASLAGAASGLIAGVPLYYFFGTRGIVPAMIILSLTMYGCMSYGLSKAVPKRARRFSWQEHSPIMRKMLSMGIILLAATLINTSCTYAINIFIRVRGDLAHVGLFNAANSVTLQYTGVVFTAMAMDYFPRLSAAANDFKKMSMIISRQMEIVALIATPMAILLVASAPVVIRLLLTDEFLPVTGLMRWLGISILLKAVAYPLGYVTFAKDNRKLFFWLEAVACNVLYIALSLIFYYFFGLMGLGYAAVVEQAACIILYLAVNYFTYRFNPSREAWTETLVGILFGAAGFCASIATEGPLTYYLMACVFLICTVRSFIILKRRLA